MARNKGADRPFALNDEAERHRLHPSRRQLRLNQTREERREPVTNQAIEDSARLLGIHQVKVDGARVGKGFEDGPFGNLTEGDPMAVYFGNSEGLGHMPGDRLPLAVKVRCEPNRSCLLGGTSDVIKALLLVFNDLVDRCEAVLHIDRHAPLLRLLGEVPNMPIGGEHGVIGAEISFNRLGLGRRLDDNEVSGCLCHGRERSTDPRTRRQRPPR